MEMMGHGISASLSQNRLLPGPTTTTTACHHYLLHTSAHTPACLLVGGLPHLLPHLCLLFMLHKTHALHHYHLGQRALSLHYKIPTTYYTKDTAISHLCTYLPNATAAALICHAGCMGLHMISTTYLPGKEEVGHRFRWEGLGCMLPWLP